jgi:hypothetical protein
MEQPILSDKSVYPSEEVIFSHIGKAKALWLLLFDSIHRNHPDFAEEWRYYNDGKSWLMKVTRKKKTVFWLSIAKGSFRTTCYFGGKAAKLVEDSDLSEEMKEQYRGGKKFGVIHAITIQYKNRKDVKEAERLIELKLQVK